MSGLLIIWEFAPINRHLDDYFMEIKLLKVIFSNYITKMAPFVPPQAEKEIDTAP